MGPVEGTVLQRVAAGDSVAVRECIDRFGGLVWSLARRMLGQSAEAEDAVQEIFVEVWESAGRYDPDIASEAAFVAMIARRRLIDRRRRLSRRPEATGLDDRAGEVAAAEVEERRSETPEARRAWAALEMLPSEQQKVLYLALVQGLTQEKISRSLNMPLGTVKTHSRRGLIRIREILGATGTDARSAAAPSEVGA